MEKRIGPPSFDLYTVKKQDGSGGLLWQLLHLAIFSEGKIFVLFEKERVGSLFRAEKCPHARASVYNKCK